MSVVYRIGLAVADSVSDQAFGSTLAPARWHSAQAGVTLRQVIYTAGIRALAQLEQRVHANGIAPVGQALFRLKLPDGLVIPTAQSIGLPAGWRDSESITQSFGDRWLDSGANLALWVPSYVEPAEYNLLINARHRRLPEVMLVKERDPFEFAPRLI